MLNVPIIQLPHAQGLPLPAYATSGSAGLDLIAAVETDMVIRPGARALVPAGIAIALPEGFEAQVRPRSGLALKHGITVLNSPGTVDSDYRGELKVILANLSAEDYMVERGSRIAQLVIAPVTRIEWQQTESLEETARASGGFGSTGVHTSAA